MATKLISLRLDTRTLSALSWHMVHFRYWKRHAVMCNILTSILLSLDSKSIGTLIHWDPWGTKKLVITIEEVDK